ncbi:hypothetical protein ACO0QE_000197 [Hanseniaspora vineae]
MFVPKSKQIVLLKNGIKPVYPVFALSGKPFLHNNRLFHYGVASRSANALPSIGKQNYSTETTLKKEVHPTGSATATSTKSTEITPINASSSAPSNSPKKTKKLTLKEKIKHEIKHYVTGTKLLGYEIKISTKLLWRLISGYELTRRESQQLKRTMKDVFRLVPFSAFLIIPFAELLLPFALKIFPNLLPSTYESSKDKLKKNTKMDEIRDKTKKFLVETLKESNSLNSKKTNNLIYESINDEKNKSIFFKFFHKLNSTKDSADQSQNVFTKDEIIKVSKMFKDDIVLDNLSRPQLIAIAKYMSLRPIGTNDMLRAQIRMQLNKIKEDDWRLDYENQGANLSFDELYQVCVVRGIKTFGVTQKDLQERLKVWLTLRLQDKIPGVLLILSSAYTFDISATTDVAKPTVTSTNYVNSTDFNRLMEIYYDGILRVLSSIPDPVYDITRLDVTEEAEEAKKQKELEQKELEKQKQKEEKSVSAETRKDEVALAVEEITKDVLPLSEDKVENKEETAAEKETAENKNTRARQEENLTLKHSENEYKLNVLKEQEKLIKEEEEAMKHRHQDKDKDDKKGSKEETEKDAENNTEDKEQKKQETVKKDE